MMTGRYWGLVLGGLLAWAVPAAAAVSDGTSNTIQFVGVDGQNNLRKIGVRLIDDNSSYFGDGSVRTIIGDGSVRTISIGQGVVASLCVNRGTVVGGVRDGSSNTIILGQNSGQNTGLQVTGDGSVRTIGSPRSILDGSSNTTIVDGSSLAGTQSFCLGGVTQPVVVPWTGTTGQGVYLGAGATLDLCVSSARVAIGDGTSNTIQLGETRSALCLAGLVPASSIRVVTEVPEPGLTPLLVGLLAAGAVARRRLRESVVEAADIALTATEDAGRGMVELASE